MAVALRPWVDVRGRRAMLVSVPMHPRKRQRRGIDQAAFLAERVAQRLGLRYLPRVLRRTRETLPQGDPRVTSREENVRDAFGLWHPWPLLGQKRLLGQRRLLGQTIILVDDVRSSGSTARSCADTLRSAGASCVVLVTGSVS
jgi:predicted amidophosphoribosyltransferase